VKTNLQEAKSFIKNINYRNDTLLTLSKSILSHQIDFFNGGIEKLKPLTLKDVAFDINVHESTVSRLTNGKYIETPYGVFELKFFFSSSIINNDGENFSSISIKQKIKKIILLEDKLNPHSDEKIADMLSIDGIKLARRTVAKYRESLNLESSSKRKTK
jgi:RNA polymerase sigma-54 factor